MIDGPAPSENPVPDNDARSKVVKKASIQTPKIPSSTAAQNSSLAASPIETITNNPTIRDEIQVGRPLTEAIATPRVQSGSENPPLETQQQIDTIKSQLHNLDTTTNQDRDSDSVGNAEKLSSDAQASFDQKDRYAGSTVIGERFFADYCYVFGFDESELVGKQVLDVGSGLLMRFAREAMKKGISVVSLNPEFAKEDVRDEPQNYDIYGKKLWFWQKWRNKLPPQVAGIAQYLPFKDDSFDVLTGFLSVPLYLPDDKAEISKAFSEMMRVLKPGGSMNFVYWPREEKEGYIQDELKHLEEAGNLIIQRNKIVENIEANVVKVIKQATSSS